MVRFQPSFLLWPRPQCSESPDGFAAWIVDREGLRPEKPDAARALAIQRIIEDYRDSSVGHCSENKDRHHGERRVATRQ